MATLKLVDFLQKLKNNSKSVYFGDLMRKGYHSAIILNAVELTGAKLEMKNGYTAITF